MYVAPSMLPEEALAMRADMAIWLVAARARLMGQKEQKAAREEPEVEYRGDLKVIKIRSKEQLLRFGRF